MLFCHEELLHLNLSKSGYHQDIVIRNMTMIRTRESVRFMKVSPLQKLLLQDIWHIKLRNWDKQNSVRFMERANFMVFLRGISPFNIVLQFLLRKWKKQKASRITLLIYSITPSSEARYKEGKKWNIISPFSFTCTYVIDTSFLFQNELIFLLIHVD